MSMLYDDLVHGYETNNLGRLADSKHLPAFKRAFVVNAQNVADYLLHGGKELWTYDDFPNVAPPFPEAWFEYRIKSDQGPHTIGVLVYGMDLWQEELSERQRAMKLFGISALEAVFAAGDEQAKGKIRWLLRIAEFKRFPGGELLELGSVWALVGDRGQILSPKEHIRFTPSDVFMELLDTNARQGVIEQGEDKITLMRDTMKSMLFPVWLSLTFMHCRNIRTEKLPAVSEKLQKARRERGKSRLHRAHVIVIDPMKKAIHAATGEQSYTTKALHIVRGHFREYDDKPLFGKYRGTFWVPMHAAGGEGELQKHPYKVKSPS